MKQGPESRERKRTRDWAFACPLDCGVRIVEASAGTGKTYCIQTLYTRLVVQCGLPVDRILLVTFTEAATKELRERIRLILSKALGWLEGALPADDEDGERIRSICALPVRRE